MSLAALAVGRPIATTMLLGAAVLLGVASLLRMEVTLLPEVDTEQIVVWVPDPDAGVPEIEHAVARPIEDALVSVRGVAGVRSHVVPGGVRVELRLYPGTDAELATLGVRERLEAMRWELPEGTGRPIVLSETSRDRPAMVLALAAEDLESAAQWAESVLRPRLEQVDGVARARIEGAPKKEIRVLLDPQRMQAARVGAGEVVAAIRAANVAAPGGYLRRRGIRYALHLESELRDPADIENVVVGGTPNQPVRVRDVGHVEDGIAPPVGWSRLDGSPAVGIRLESEAGANLLRTAARVHERLRDLRAEFPEFQVAVIQDPAPFVRRSISNLWQAVWLGSLLAFGVLLYFLNDVRSPAILMTTLPVAVISACAVLDMLGVSLNILSLGGIALSVGTLVDNSIICLDNIHRLRALGMSPARAAAQGAREVSLPMLASTLTTLAVFVPLAWVPGRIGTLFRDQAMAVAVSQLTSLLTSLTLLPMLAARISTVRRRRERLPFFAAYHRLLVICLRRPAGFLAVLAVLLVASVVVLVSVPREILPEVASEDLEMQLALPPGSDVTATGAAALELETWLEARPEVERIHTTVGAAGSLDPSETGRQFNRATLRVRLKPSGIAHRQRVTDGIAAVAARRGDWQLEVLPSRPELASMFLGGVATLTCEIAGPVPQRAGELAARVTAVAQTALAHDAHPVQLQASADEPRYSFELDEAALWRYGLSADEATRAVQTRTAGYEATRLRRFDEEHPVVVREAEAEPTTGTVVIRDRAYPLRDLFRVRTELAPADLLRVDQTQVTTIRWDGPLHGAGRVQHELARAVATVGLPPGYSVRFGGDWQEMRTTLGAILRVFALSAGLVFLILAAQFESLRLPLLIFSDIPLALIGVAVALLVGHQSLNALSLVGMVILNGIVVNDSILKVDLLRRLQAEGVGRLRAIFITSRRHYRPIWMTTTTTVLGLVPLFFGTGREMMSSLATTVIGGLIVSTLLTLLVVPVLFHRIARRPGGAA